MSIIKFIFKALKCKSSCSINEDYCPDKCKDMVNNIHKLEINEKNMIKIFKILNKSPSIMDKG